MPDPNLQDEDREIFLSVANTNLLLVTERLRELAASASPGGGVIVDADELEALAEMVSSVRVGL